MPAFSYQRIDRQALFWELEGNRAVRDGDWKLVSKHGEPWELYDVSKDRVEANNLAEKHPDRVEELSAKYNAYAERALVEPWPVANRR
jgi:arylsulfatase